MVACETSDELAYSTGGQKRESTQICQAIGTHGCRVKEPIAANEKG